MSPAARCRIVMKLKKKNLPTLPLVRTYVPMNQVHTIRPILHVPVRTQGTSTYRRRIVPFRGISAIFNKQFPRLTDIEQSQ